MTVRATQEDVERLASELDGVVRAAEQLERELRSRDGVNPEGAVEVREIAASLAARASSAAAAGPGRSASGATAPRRSRCGRLSTRRSVSGTSGWAAETSR